MSLFKLMRYSWLGFFNFQHFYQIRPLTCFLTCKYFQHHMYVKNLVIKKIMHELFKLFRWHKRKFLNKTSWPRFGILTARLSNYYLNSTFKTTPYNYFFFSLFFAGQSTMTFVSVKKQVHISMHLLLTRKDTITTVCTQQIIFHWIIQSIYQVSKLYMYRLYISIEQNTYMNSNICTAQCFLFHFL